MSADDHVWEEVSGGYVLLDGDRRILGVVGWCPVRRNLMGKVMGTDIKRVFMEHDLQGAERWVRNAVFYVQ